MFCSVFVINNVIFVSKFKTLRNSCWFQHYFNKDDAN